MPRAVPPWLHRVCVRRFGPLDPWKKLLLYTINAFMDDAGETDVGQEAIATAATMGVSTVRAKTNSLSKEGWLALYTRGQAGRKWKSYFYRACVPDWIDLEKIPIKDNYTAAELADRHEETNGAIESATVRGTLYPQKGKRRAPPRAGGSQTRAPPAERNEHHQPANGLPPADGDDYRQPVGGKSSSEKSSKKVLPGKGVLTRTALAGALGKNEVASETEAEKTMRIEAARRKALEDIAHIQANGSGKV